MLIASLAALTLATPDVGAEIDKLIEAELAAKKIPGLSLVITKDDAVIKRSVYGKADVEQDLPMTTEHVFESGSIGKSFTAVVVLQLVQEGKLGLDDKLGDRLKDCPEAWKAITIRQLLNQQTGLADYATIPGVGLTETWTYAQWLEIMGKQKFDFPTGSQFAYSNTNYLLLGKIAEQAAGEESIIGMVQKRVFDPLGMKHSYNADQMSIIPKRAHGYLNLGARIGNGLFIAPGYGDGSFINSPEDLVAYEKGFREGKLLKPENMALAQNFARLPSGRKTAYGMGWFSRDVNGTRVVSHGGNTAGFFASLTRIESAKLTIVLMGNLHDQSGDGLALRLAELYLPDLKPKKLTPKDEPNAALAAKLLKGLQALAKQQTDPELMDADMIARLATGRGRMAMGAFRKFESSNAMAYLETVPDEPDTIVRYLVTAGETKWVVSFTVTKDGKIYSVGQRPD